MSEDGTIHFQAVQEDTTTTKLVKDPLWGSIALLPWEQRITRHPAFTRLHSIVQNSSAYKVYPALKVSRFIHTLGVMQVVTRIFEETLSQSEEGIQESVKDPHTLETEAKLALGTLDGTAQNRLYITPARISSDIVHAAAA